MNAGESSSEPSRPPLPPADHAGNPDFHSHVTDQGLPRRNKANTSQITSESPSTFPHHYPFLSRRHRILLGSFGAFLFAGFLLAVFLKPNPQGYGTHRSLGLPPCSMRVMFGIPCPSCGMTTSFSHFVRGELPSSLRANAAGTLLAGACAVLMLWTLSAAWKGRYLCVSDPATVLAYGLSGLAALTLLHWVWRLWLDGYV